MRHTRKTVSIDSDRIPEAPDPPILRDKLLAAGIEVQLDAIAQWTPTDKILAANYAEALHLVASDNVLNEFCRAHDEVKLTPAPACICLPPKPAILGGTVDANCPNCGTSPFTGNIKFMELPTGNFLAYLLCNDCGAVMGCQLAGAELLFPQSELTGADGKPMHKSPTGYRS
ncbi:MAG TPA: hypothetical protein VG345_16545 [Bryobacteraceae bacterium]|jgi:hypothetical protein|nr:hypothetical protein [Bryobacteraceae bacterium]